ncbi:ASKHA domain-containing protein [Ruminococcaceae bacterium OttesenSCG-928-A11]|nr:ASKHA domain-containing protein [Ruminococcaceae bacterium OttesenSCG-928-A11]
MDVKFSPSGKCLSVDEDLTLLEAAERAGVLIDGSCGGRGTCGKCKVTILSGEAPPPDAAELEALTGWELEEDTRLACRVRAKGPLEVLVPEHHGGAARRKGMAKLPPGFVPDIRLKKYPAVVARATLNNQKSDLERILLAAGLQPQDYEIDHSLIATVHPLLEETGGAVTVVTRDGRVVGLEPGDSAGAAFGIAFDIGTTTVVGILCDLAAGTVVDTAARTNPQSVFGADVISRIQYASQSGERLRAVQQMVADCMNDIIDGLTAEHGVAPEQLYDVTVAGNTTMSHLFLGVDAIQMARSPFAPVFSAAVTVDAPRLRLNVNPGARVYLLPGIAGHVGADITGVLLTTGLCTRPGANLAVDIGTNGEILLAKDGRTVTCSTAAGPAFEGAAIYQGMRAANGAIEGVTIAGGEVLLRVIGDDEPVGICGSGLVDATAQLLDAGIVGSKGRFLSRQAALDKGLHPKLAERLYEDGAGSGFVLYQDGSGRKVVLTQKDIREIQLAKGAIAAGIKILMDVMGVRPEDLRQVLVAGAFGNYINKESALRIGLLPQVPPEKVEAIGNAAGTGVCMALLSEETRHQAEREAARVEHIELSNHPDFKDEHLRGMFFPE